MRSACLDDAAPFGKGAVSKMPVSAEEIRQAFRDRLKALPCPHCGRAYTDRAVEWCEAWLEGRRDLMRELGRDARDGPIKLKCEACGDYAMTNAFFAAPKPS